MIFWAVFGHLVWLTQLFIGEILVKILVFPCAILCSLAVHKLKIILLALLDNEMG